MIKDASREIEKLTEKIKELEETIEYERKEKDKISEEKDRIVKNFEKVKKEFKAKHSITVTNLHRAMNIKANSRNVSDYRKGCTKCITPLPIRPQYYTAYNVPQAWIKIKLH